MLRVVVRVGGERYEYSTVDASDDTVVDSVGSAAGDVGSVVTMGNNAGSSGDAWVPNWVREQEARNGAGGFNARASAAAQHRVPVPPRPAPQRPPVAPPVPRNVNNNPVNSLPATIPDGTPFNVCMGFLKQLVDHVGGVAKQRAGFTTLHKSLQAMFNALAELDKRVRDMHVEFDYGKYSRIIGKLYGLVYKALNVPDYTVQRMMPGLLKSAEKVRASAVEDTQGLTEHMTDGLLTELDGLIGELDGDDMMKQGMDELGFNTAAKRNTSNVKIDGVITDPLSEDDSLFGDDEGSEGTIFDSTPGAANTGSIDIPMPSIETADNDNVLYNEGTGANSPTTRNNDDPINMSDVMDAFTIKTHEWIDRLNNNQ